MAIACSCFGLRDSEITDVIRDGACTVEGVTEACGAGGGCGSCLPTIEVLVSIEGAPGDALAVA